MTDTIYLLATFTRPFRDNFLTAHFWVRIVTLLVSSSQFLSIWRCGPTQTLRNLTGLRSRTQLDGINMLLQVPNSKPTDILMVNCRSWNRLVVPEYDADNLSLWSDTTIWTSLAYTNRHPTSCRLSMHPACVAGARESVHTRETRGDNLAGARAWC